VCDEAYGLSSQLGGLDVELRLPLVELAAAALRQLSPAQYDRFAANVQALIDADGRTTLFEYTLQRWLLRQLGIFFGRVQPPPPRPDDTRPVRDDAAVLLSAAARVEAATEEAAERAFRAGVATLHATDAPAGLLPPTRCGLAQVDAALHHLAGAAPRNKRVVLAACAATTAADGRVGPKEAELLRAIAGNLDCPLPPTPGNNPAPQPE
jgi:hypothetical protein